MARTTPLVAAGQLREPQTTLVIVLGSSAWFAWLAEQDHHTFHFHHPLGDFTARKERKQRGQTYWVAYRQVQGKLYKRYLGKAEMLTEAHLIAVAATLAQPCVPSPTPPEDTRSAP